MIYHARFYAWVLPSSLAKEYSCKLYCQYLNYLVCYAARSLSYYQNPHFFGINDLHVFLLRKFV